MIYLLVSFILFLIFTGIHILVHRFLAKRGILTLMTGMVFLPGLLLDIYILLTINLSDPLSIPISGIFFYILLVMILVIFYTAPAFSYVSPSTMILVLLEKNKKMTYDQMSEFFSNDKIVTARLKDLKHAGLINIKQNMCFITNKGNKTASFINFYRNLLNFNQPG